MVGGPKITACRLAVAVIMCASFPSIMTYSYFLLFSNHGRKRLVCVLFLKKKNASIYAQQNTFQL